MITNFPANPLANMSGLQLFSFSPYQNINTLPAIAKMKIIAPVVFKAGYSFLSGYSTIGQLNFTEKFTNDENGGLYSWLITGYAPGDSDTLVNLFEEMKTCRHLVTTVDNNRVKRLVGYNAPLDFSADYDSGKIPGTDMRGYAFTFSGQGKSRAPVYNV